MQPPSVEPLCSACLSGEIAHATGHGWIFSLRRFQVEANPCLSSISRKVRSQYVTGNRRASRAIIDARSWAASLSDT